MKHHRKGIIAISTAIIISAILTSIGISLLLTSIDTAQSNSINALNEQVESLQRGCLEEAIYFLDLNREYLGQIPIDFPTSYTDLSCMVTVTDGGSQTRIIEVTASMSNLIITNQWVMDTSSDVATVTTL